MSKTVKPFLIAAAVLLIIIGLASGFAGLTLLGPTDTSVGIVASHAAIITVAIGLPLSPLPLIDPTTVTREEDNRLASMP